MVCPTAKQSRQPSGREEFADHGKFLQRMDDRNGSLQEPLFPAAQLEEPQHTFTFANCNGVTRLVRRRDETISCTPEWIWSEITKQLYITGPMVCVALLQYLVTVVSVIFLGHSGELELAAASIAASFAFMSGTTLIVGLATALETLCSQAYGAKQYRMLGIYLQRAVFVLYLVALPIAVVWWNMDTLLIFLGQDPEISELAGAYARYLVPSIFAAASLQPLVKFLQAQSLVLPMAMFSVTTLILHVPLCWILIYKVGLGFRGAALASSMSQWLNVLWHALYVKYSTACKRTWTSFSTEVFIDLPAFMKLAIPSVFMISLGNWAFEGLVLVSGLLPNPQLETSTLSICLTSTALLYMVPFGIGAAASTRVGNELGAGRPQAAKGAVAVAVAIGLTQGVLITTGLYALRSLWGKAFTNEQEIIDYVAVCIPLLAIKHLMDSILGVLAGVARGCGRQAFCAYANLGAHYLVGWPAAVVLAFVYDLRGRGLWLGVIMGMVTQTVTYVIWTCATNWQQEAEDAMVRVHSGVFATLPIESIHAQKDEIPPQSAFDQGC